MNCKSLLHIIFIIDIKQKAIYKYISINKSLAFLVLITGIVGGLFIVFSILFLCKYCINRKNLREAEQVKLLYETLNQTSLLDSNRLYQCRTQQFSPLEPRRSNPLDRYQIPEDQQRIISSKTESTDYHISPVQDLYNQSYHENQEQIGKKQNDSYVYGNISNDDEPAEQYLQVDPRCYVRQKTNNSSTIYRKSETPRLEKGHSINVDTRPSSTSASLSPYRQSSFDVTLFYHSQNEQPLTPSSAISTQQEIYFTPRGSSLSVIGNISTNTPPGSQHLSIPTPTTSRQNSTIEKKDLTVNLDTSRRTSTIRSSIVQREHEHSRSLEHSSSLNNNSSVDNQSRSFDAVHLLRPIIHREDVVINRRTKSYEYAEEEHQPSSPIAPPPIIIKIPDMRELVQAAKLNNNNLNEYQQNSRRNSSLVRQIIINNHNNGNIIPEDLWRLHQSYQFEEQQQQQQQLDRTSPEDFSPDLLTSTSIDSAGAMVIHQESKNNNNNPIDDDPSKYEYRRKSSSNLLLPPPEVRRQALRRTFEKRRSCINQSNAKREQQLINNQTILDDDYNQSSTLKSTEFSSLLNNFNSKSENSSFDRSLETDFDMQSDTSSRGPNDQFTSIESSGNENTLPDVNHHLLINRQQQQQRQTSHQDDSGYKSLESQNSQNHTFSLDWISADGGETVICMDEPRKQQQQQRSVDLKEDFTEQQISNNNRPTILNYSSNLSNSNTVEQRSITPRTNFLANKLVTSSSFNRTASKKRREFGKDKRHATSNVGLPHIITTDEYRYSPPIISQINEINTKQTSSTLQVQHPDLRRSKSDETEVLDESNKNNTHLTSSADGISDSIPLANHTKPKTIGDSRHIFQRSPSSTTPPVAISPQIVAFRSKRGSISFDNQTPPPNSSISNTTVTKPRLKFSMVRDTTTASLGSTTSNYSMPLANDFIIDEKTNRTINEFLMQDTNNMKNDISHEEMSKHYHQRIRQKTFDETVLINKNNSQKQSRTAFIKQRQPSSSHYPSIHLSDSSEQSEDKNNLLSSSSTLTQQSGTIAHQNNSITVGSPSIIVTGYESGS